MSQKSANAQRVKIFIFLFIVVASLLLAISGALPTIINLALTPWEWFCRAFLLKNKIDALASIPFLHWLGVTYRYMYISIFWFVQVIQCAPSLMELWGFRFNPERHKAFNKLRWVGYGIELVVNITYGCFNPWGTDDTFILYRLIVTLLSIVAQTFAFEWTLGVICLAVTAFAGSAVDTARKAPTVKVNATVAD